MPSFLFARYKHVPFITPLNPFTLYVYTYPSREKYDKCSTTTSSGGEGVASLAFLIHASSLTLLLEKPEPQLHWEIRGITKGTVLYRI